MTESKSVPRPRPEVDLGAHAQDGGRAYQVGQGSQYITEHTEHYYYQASVAEGTAAPVVLPVVADAEQLSGFVARPDEITALLGVLDPSRADPGPVVVSGLPGVGKTTLAWQVARAAVGRGWFAGGAVFVDLHGYEPKARIEPGLVFAPMLHALGVASRDVPSTVAEQAAAYHQVLAALAQQHRPVLLVLDNASEPGQIAPLLPMGRAHRVLVTSGHSLGALEGAHLVEVNVLDPIRAVALLERALQRQSPGDRRLQEDPERAAALAALCGYLPLALQIVAALLAEEPGRPVSELVAELAEAGARLETLAYEEVTVRAAFDLSYRDLPEDQARLFRLLSAAPGPDVSTEVAAVVADQPPSRVRRGLAGLARAHLIQRGTTTTNRWQMHRLIRLYAVEQAEAHAEQDQRDLAITRVLDHYLTTIQAAIPRAADCPLLALDSPLLGLAGAAVANRFTDRHQAGAWLQAERPNLVAAVALAAATSHLETATALSSHLCEFLFRHRYLDDWLSSAEVAVRAARELGNRHCEGETLTKLGNALREVGRVEEAIPSLKQAVAIFREIRDRYQEGVALGGLGLALRQVGRFEEAITSLEQALAIYREIGNRDHLEGMALDILGLALRQVGRFEEAITSLERAVTIYHDTADLRNEGSALDSLGVTLQWVRRSEETIPSLQQATAIFQEAGDQHHEGIALDALGQALRKVRRYEEAITSFEQAVTIYHNTADRHSEGTALTYLGVTLAEVGRFEEAHERAARAVELLVAVEADEDALWARNLMERCTRTSPPTSSPPPERRWPLPPLPAHPAPPTTVQSQTVIATP
ncbi:MAG: tetratricopeptide repeat protein, partial [Actinobacteria bacterium]|nr:tetratricopeptide repeat protein [Actinomycetota bacterium]